MALRRPNCDEKEGGLRRPITIRAAGPAEAEVVWRLTVEAYLPDRERLHPPSGVFRETVPDVQRAMDEGTVYVAQCGADIVGAVRVQPARDQDALYCGRLAVLPAARRRGIGTALMERVERHACEAGYPGRYTRRAVGVAGQPALLHAARLSHRGRSEPPRLRHAHLRLAAQRPHRRQYGVTHLLHAHLVQ
jgi:predicted N-acetyltransferase YhbS